MNLEILHQRALIRWKSARASKKKSDLLFAEQHKYVIRILKRDIRARKRHLHTGRDNRQLELAA